MEQNRTHNSAAAVRRQQQIELCLYENLRHIPFQSISVSDLCRQVGISRKAFYNYYPDKEACLCAIIDHTLRESVLHITAGVGDNASPLEASTVLLEYWKEKKELFDILVRNNLVHLLLLRNMEYVLREDHTVLDLLNTPDVRSDTDILACCMSSMLTLVLQWHFRGFDTPTEEMARKLLRLLHAPMFHQNEA